MLKYTFFFIIIFIVGDYVKTNLNIDNILKYIEKVNDPTILENYIKRIEDNIDIKNNETAKIILDKANDRLNKLKGINTIEELFQEAEKKTDKLKNISIIDTEKEMNDKINGFRKDVTYIKFNDTNEIFEVTNVNKVKAFLSNKEILDTLTENEIRRYLIENSNEIDTRKIENKNNDNLDIDKIKEEIDEISEQNLRNRFIEEKENILKEREIVNEYVRTNNSSAQIEYGLNSNGERVYNVGDKIIKFEGKERNMQILSKDKIEENNISTSNFEQYNNGYNSNEYNESYYLKNLDKLNIIKDNIVQEYPINEEEYDFVKNFLEFCVSNEEKSIINNLELQKTFNDFYALSNKFGDDIQVIFERKDNLINKTDKERYDRDYSVEHTKVLRFIQNNNDNLSGLDKAAFVSVAVILEATLVGTLIIALISLVK